MLTINHAQAEGAVPYKFRFALGGYALPGFESEVSLTEPNLGAGISISPEDTLGLDSEQTVLRLDGHYRFTKQHALIPGIALAQMATRRLKRRLTGSTKMVIQLLFR